jgi:hypothetical protein
MEQMPKHQSHCSVDRASSVSGILSMKRRTIRLTVLLVLAVLMFLASGQHGSYFCVSPWAGDGPLQGPGTNADP